MCIEKKCECEVCNFAEKTIEVAYARAAIIAYKKGENMIPAISYKVKKTILDLLEKGQELKFIIESHAQRNELMELLDDNEYLVMDTVIPAFSPEEFLGIWVFSNLYGPIDSVGRFTSTESVLVDLETGEYKKPEDKTIEILNTMSLKMGNLRDELEETENTLAIMQGDLFNLTKKLKERRK